MNLTDMHEGITIVTGTDTDVGKTIATAVLTRWLLNNGVRPAVCKPAQTGISAEEPGDLAAVQQLSGIDREDLYEFVRLPEPLAPAIAGRRAGIPLPSMAQIADELVELRSRYPCVVVEGAGGLLVQLDDEGHGLVELAEELTARGHQPRFIVVTRSVLGTLNQTELTACHLAHHSQNLAGIIIGSWHCDPDLAELCNLAPLEAIAPLLAVLPAGIGNSPQDIAQAADSFGGLGPAEGSAGPALQLR